MQISSEKISSRFLEINNCNIQHLGDRDYHMLRAEGRADYHILYIISGRCRVIEGGQEIVAGAGSVILYRPHERQEYAFSGVDNSVSAYVHFSGTACDEILAACRAFGGRVTYVGGAKKPERVFREMVDEFCLKKPCWQENATALFLQFLAVAARGAAYDATAVNATLEHSMDEVLRQMHRHYAENHDVAYYAAMCHLSVGRFAHAFKESTGVSPKQYLLRIKIDIACNLLATTNLTVAEVGEAVGVADVNYFSRLVKKYTGRTPRDQR